jgi:hypothetical protein
MAEKLNHLCPISLGPVICASNHFAALLLGAVFCHCPAVLKAVPAIMAQF